MSYYIELPVMLIMYVGWKLLKRTKLVRLEVMDLETDVHKVGDEDLREEGKDKGLKGKVRMVLRWIF